jgi:hypothetical protein
MLLEKNYQEDLRTPGIIPSFANSRKQIRQSPKSRINAFPRPHLKQRFFARTGNFGFFSARAFVDVFAIGKIN